MFQQSLKPLRKCVARTSWRRGPNVIVSFFYNGKFDWLKRPCDLGEMERGTTLLVRSSLSGRSYNNKDVFLKHCVPLFISAASFVSFSRRLKLIGFHKHKTRKLDASENVLSPFAKKKTTVTIKKKTKQKKKTKKKKQKKLLSFRHHSERRFFAWHWHFILNENILF